MTGTTSKRSLLITCAVGLFLCLLATIIPTTPGLVPAIAAPYIRVTSAGLTNNASGVTMAQFNIENLSPRPLRFTVGQVQVHHPDGWTNWLVFSGKYQPLPLGTNHIISIPVPTLSTSEGAAWRVPILSEPEPPLLDQLRDRIHTFAFRVLHWRLPRASRRMGAAIAFSPEMPGLTDSQTNRTASGSTDPK
jgi:hypothetical protein